MYPFAFDSFGNFLDLYWMLGDHQGSVTSVLSHNNGQTSVVQQLAYTAFGAIGSIKDGQGNNVTTGPISRFAYTGREFDPETGDYYYRARYYDPQSGRFLSQDPIGFAAGDMNLYRYVGNSSPNWVDPSGLRADERMTSGPSSPIGHAGPVRYNDGAPYEMLPGFTPPRGDQSNYYWRTNGFGDPVLDPTITIVPPGPVGGPIMIVEPPATGIPPEPTLIVRPPGSFPGDPRVLEPLPGMPKWITDIPYEVAAGGAVCRLGSAALTASRGREGVIVGEYLARKAPKQVAPGTRVLIGQYIDDLGRVQPWRAHYDEFGRLIARTDFNACNKVQGIPSIHYHLYEYNQRFPLGRQLPGHFPGEFRW